MVYGERLAAWRSDRSKTETSRRRGSHINRRSMLATRCFDEMHRSRLLHTKVQQYTLNATHATSNFTQKEYKTWALIILPGEGKLLLHVRSIIGVMFVKSRLSGRSMEWTYSNQKVQFSWDDRRRARRRLSGTVYVLYAAPCSTSVCMPACQSSSCQCIVATLLDRSSRSCA